MTKIQHKRSSVLVSGSAQAPSASQLDYGELAINYSSSDPQFFIKDSSGSVISVLNSYAALDGANFTGDVNFDADVTIKGDSTNSGAITLNSETNAKYVKIQAPVNSSLTSYTLTLPNTDGGSGEVLSTDGSGGLSWAYAAMYTADKTKLDGIETGATADQTGAEIKSLYQAQPNAFTDAQFTKLSGIETGATADQTGAEIKSLYQAQTNAFTDALFTKLSGIETGATADQSASEILNLVKTVDGSGSGLDADKLDGLQASAFLRSDSDTYTGYKLRINQNSTSGTDYGLWVHNSNTGPSNIQWSNGNTDQLGFLKFYHQDGSSNSAACSFHFDSNQTGVAVIIDDTGSNSGYYVGTNKVWHAGNDGAGSGLDADNLDGKTWNSSGKDLRGTEIYADNWFRNYNDGEGLYNQATGIHWHANGDGYWCARDGSNHIGIRMKTNGSTTRGTFYANNSNDIGILDSDGSWAIRVRRDNDVSFRVNNTEYSKVTSDYLNHTSDIRSPIFYDSDNTGYYVNPASTSKLNQLEIRGWLDMADGDAIRMGSSDDWTVSFNSNNWLYINQKQSGIIFQDNGTNKMRLEDSGVFRPEGNNTGTIGHSDYYWSNGYFQNFNVSGTINVRGALDLADNDILRFGSGDDCEMFVNGSHMYMDLNGGIGNFYIRDGTTTRFTFNDNGAFTATNNITAYSDIKLKKNIERITNALDKVQNLRGVTYERIEEGIEGRKLGVIAQEVQKVIPEVVSYHEEEDILSVDYGNIVGLLIEAIKEQQQQIKELKSRVENS